MICTTAHAVGYEIDLSFGKSQRDMVFLGQPVELPMAKKRRIAERQRAF